MHFNLPQVLIVCALVASFVLVFRASERIPAFIALAVSGLEALIAFRLVTINAPSSFGLILAAALAAAGAWSWSRASSKPSVSAATVVVLIGVIQLLWALRILA
jgi:drug/metabolite transporter (DMT)-like permease